MMNKIQLIEVVIYCLTKAVNKVLIYSLLNIQFNTLPIFQIITNFVELITCRRR